MITCNLTFFYYSDKCPSHLDTKKNINRYSPNWPSFFQNKTKICFMSCLDFVCRLQKLKPCLCMELDPYQSEFFFSIN